MSDLIIRAPAVAAEATADDPGGGPKPGEDLVIRAPAASADAGTDTGVKPDKEPDDGVD